MWDLAAVSTSGWCRKFVWFLFTIGWSESALSFYQILYVQVKCPLKSWWRCTALLKMSLQICRVMRRAHKNLLRKVGSVSWFHEFKHLFWGVWCFCLFAELSDDEGLEYLAQPDQERANESQVCSFISEFKSQIMDMWGKFCAQEHYDLPSFWCWSWCLKIQLLYFCRVQILIQTRNWQMLLQQHRAYNLEDSLWKPLKWVVTIDSVIYIPSLLKPSRPCLLYYRMWCCSVHKW